MPKVNDKAIEKRAGELAAKDGYVWELTFKPRSGYEKIRDGQVPVPEERRDEYRARARAELGGSNA